MPASIPPKTTAEPAIRQIQAEDTWPLRHRVMWPDQPFEFVKVDEDSQGIHYGLFVGNALVSVVSLFTKEDKAQFRKLATETSQQGKGYGSMLLNFLLERVSELPVGVLWCNARADKTGFYEKFGFRLTATTYEKGGIRFVVMEKPMHERAQ